MRDDDERIDEVGPGLHRRRFLGLLAGSAATLVTGCGDDSIAADTEGSESTGGTTGDPSTGSQSSTGPHGTGETGTDSVDASSGEDGTDTSTGTDTDEPVECEEFPEIDFDPESILQNDSTFPLAVMAGEMKPDSVMLAVYVDDVEPKTLRVWTPGTETGKVALVHEQEVVPNADGYVKVTVDGLCPGTWYHYGFFTGEPDAFTERSGLGEFRTALANNQLEVLTLAVSSCNGSSLNWPALDVMADEYYDMFIHLGDMAYNDGSFSLAEYRAKWKEYLSAEGFRRVYARAGLYATWDDHEIDDNSNFDRETMDPNQLQKRQNAMDAYFEVLPIDAEGPNYRLWRSFRWGRTAEIIVLDCRYERRPSQGLYMSQEQMDWLKERLQDSPCHFKIIMNSVPITNMPLVFDVALGDRWEGYPDSRNELLDFITQNDIQNVWFLAGDFHVCFSSRIDEGNALASRVREFAVTGGNSNPVPASLLGIDGGGLFDWGTTAPHGVLVTFDPHEDMVNVRFINPATGQDTFSQDYSYGV